MAANVLHETQLQFNREYLGFINHANALGLVDADILSLTTIAGLRAAIVGKVVHETDSNIMRQASSAMQAAFDNNCITNAEIAAADTIAGMRTQGTDNDPSLSATEQKTFAYSPRA